MSPSNVASHVSTLRWQGWSTRSGFAKAYIQATEDALKLIAKEAAGGKQPQRSLRKGSAPAKAYRALHSAGHPMHITTLVEAIGKAVTRKSRGALASSLSAYARRGEIFTRTAPNTFGLLEFGDGTEDEAETEES